MPPGSCGAGAVQARWVATASGRDRPGLLRRGTSDELSVAHRVAVYGQPRQAQEHQATAGRAAAVEPETELSELPVKVFDLHRALVGAQQPAFCQ